jgi:hypothetical protein
MSARLGGISVSRKHSGDFAHPGLALHFVHEGLISLSGDDEVLGRQSGDRCFVRDEKHLAFFREVLELVPGKQSCPSTKACFHLVENERRRKTLLGKRKLKSQQQAAQLAA